MSWGDDTEQRRWDEWQELLRADPGYFDWLESLKSQHYDPDYLAHHTLKETQHAEGK